MSDVKRYVSVVDEAGRKAATVLESDYTAPRALAVKQNEALKAIAGWTLGTSAAMRER